MFHVRCVHHADHAILVSWPQGEQCGAWRLSSGSSPETLGNGAVCGDHSELHRGGADLDSASDDRHAVRVNHGVKVHVVLMIC